MSAEKKSTGIKFTKSNNALLGQVSLIVSALLMALPVLFIWSVAIRSGSLAFVVFSVPYLVILAFTYALVTERVKSEQLKRLFIVFNVLGGASVLYLIYFVVTFPQNYTF